MTFDEVVRFAHASNMSKPIYRIRFYRGRFGEGWNAYCQPGYSSLSFPGIAGSKTLAECADWARKYIEAARQRDEALRILRKMPHADTP